MEMNNLLAVFINGFYGIINFVINGIVAILPSFSLADWLSSAFAEFGSFLGAINYFVPFSVMVDIAFAWVSAILIWHVVQFILRFVQLGS